VAGRQLLERDQLQVGRILRVDDVHAGDVRIGVRGAAEGPRVARQERELAPLVDVHVLVLPVRPARARRAAEGQVVREHELVVADLVEQLRALRIRHVIGLQAEAPGDEHHHALVGALPVREEVDRRRLPSLREVLDELHVLDRPGRRVGRGCGGRDRQSGETSGGRRCPA
jgi:hypothetical protein